MTFAEAVEKNKTARVRRCPGAYFDVGHFCGHKAIRVEDALATDWEVEPVKKEFICKWEKDLGCPTTPFGFEVPNGYEGGNSNFDQFVGKKTRVTVEVIE